MLSDNARCLPMGHDRCAPEDRRSLSLLVLGTEALGRLDAQRRLDARERGHAEEDAGEEDEKGDQEGGDEAGRQELVPFEDAARGGHGVARLLQGAERGLRPTAITRGERGRAGEDDEVRRGRGRYRVELVSEAGLCRGVNKLERCEQQTEGAPRDAPWSATTALRRPAVPWRSIIDRHTTCLAPRTAATPPWPGMELSTREPQRLEMRSARSWTEEPAVRGM